MPTSPRTTRRWGRTATTSRGVDGCCRGHALPPRTKGEGKFGDQIRVVLGMYFGTISRHMLMVCLTWRCTHVRRAIAYCSTRG